MAFHIFARMIPVVRCQSYGDAHVDEYASIDAALAAALGTVSGMNAAITEMGKLRKVASPQTSPTELGAVNGAILAANGILEENGVKYDFDTLNVPPTWIDLGGNLHQTESGGRAESDGAPWVISATLSYRTDHDTTKSASFSGYVRIRIEYLRPEVAQS